jgi:hypothetical protein
MHGMNGVGGACCAPFMWRATAVSSFLGGRDQPGLIIFSARTMAVNCSSVT